MTEAHRSCMPRRFLSSTTVLPVQWRGFTCLRRTGRRRPSLLTDGAVADRSSARLRDGQDVCEHTNETFMNIRETIHLWRIQDEDSLCLIASKYRGKNRCAVVVSEVERRISVRTTGIGDADDLLTAGDV